MWENEERGKDLPVIRVEIPFDILRMRDSIVVTKRKLGHEKANRTYIAITPIRYRTIQMVNTVNEFFKRDDVQAMINSAKPTSFTMTIMTHQNTAKKMNKRKIYSRLYPYAFDIMFLICYKAYDSYKYRAVADTAEMHLLKRGGWFDGIILELAFADKGRAKPERITDADIQKVIEAKSQPAN